MLFRKNPNIYVPNFYPIYRKNPYISYNGIYALCTKAKCKLVTDKRTNQQALSCVCNVKNGKAAGINNGQNFTPYTYRNQNFVYSLYSGINGKFLKNKRVMEEIGGIV